MTKRPIRLGEMLVQMGRVTADEVERALAHQRAHGGYMGDALVALGILTRDELWWGLANQHDIPFVHLRPENIDHELAARVPAAWAAEHRMLPVLWDEGRVTVLMPDVERLDRLEEVRLLTGASEVVPALTSPQAIAELIEAVHGPAERVGVAALLAEALEAGATGFGVSARPGRAVGWYRADAVVCRVLAPDWRGELATLVEPAGDPGTEGRWTAVARVGSELWMLECHALARGQATEWAAVPGQRLAADPAHVHADPALVQGAREARRAGGLAARVACDPGAERAAEALLALLPARLLGDSVRALHLSGPPRRGAAGNPGRRRCRRAAAGADGGRAGTVRARRRYGVRGRAGRRRPGRPAPPGARGGRAGPERPGGPDSEFDCVVRLRLDEGGPAWTFAGPE